MSVLLGGLVVHVMAIFPIVHVMAMPPVVHIMAMPPVVPIMAMFPVVMVFVKLTVGATNSLSALLRQVTVPLQLSRK
jgi:hypothetical protein